MNNPDKQPRLLLFDIDGTLVGTRTGIGRKALEEAVHQVVGKRVQIPLRMCAGRTDPNIVDSALELILEPRTHDLCDRILKQYVINLESLYQAGPDAFLQAGVLPLLEVLAARSDIRLALLTGNILEGARIKLQAFNIWRFFPVGAYGGDNRNRSELHPIVIDRAQRHWSCVFDRRQTYVIGDTIHDIDAGKAHGLVTIALGTHKEFIPELKAANPDYFLKSMDPKEAFLRIIE